MILNQTTEAQPIGYVTGDDKFLCANCAPDNAIDDDSVTPIFDSDKWFDGEICTKCDELIVRDNNEG